MEFCLLLIYIFTIFDAKYKLTNSRKYTIQILYLYLILPISINTTVSRVWIKEAMSTAFDFQDHIL